MITISKSQVLSVVCDYYPDQELDRFPHLQADKQHYKLLTYITLCLNHLKIMDAGTCHGHSALALVQNATNNVISYDIAQQYSSTLFQNYPNFFFRKMDINKETEQELQSFDLILLDVDPHDGNQESIFLTRLKAMGYSGLLLCDDIHLNVGMQKFWQNISGIPKYDLTDIGHYSGTGLVNFSKTPIKIID